MPNLTVESYAGESLDIPSSEKKILRILAELGGEAHAPAIARASDGAVSVAAIYSLLQRLERRGFVQRREVFILVGDIQARRIFYSLNSKIPQ